MALTLAVVPSATPGDSRAALEDVCARISSLLDTQIVGMHPESYSDLQSQLEKDRVQYAWMPPALIVLGNERLRLESLLSSVREERTEHRSVIFVDAASAFHTVRDLVGKTVAWVDPASASGYLVPRLHLAAKGIDPGRLFGEEMFVRSHAEVVRAVFSGRAHAGATYAHRAPQGEDVKRAGFTDVAPDHPARVLEWTQAIPSDVIAGHGLLSRAQHRLFSNAILTLAEQEDGRRALFQTFHAERFAITA